MREFLIEELDIEPSRSGDSLKHRLYIIVEETCVQGAREENLSRNRKVLYRFQLIEILVRFAHMLYCNKSLAATKKVGTYSARKVQPSPRNEYEELTPS